MKDPRKYLEGNGWKLVISRKRESMVHYWRHDDHEKEDGLWWTQGEAVIFQQRLDKTERKKK